MAVIILPITAADTTAPITDIDTGAAVTTAAIMDEVIIGGVTTAMVTATGIIEGRTSSSLFSRLNLSTSQPDRSRHVIEVEFHAPLLRSRFDIA